MPTIHDEEFGAITIRRSARARQVRIRVAPDGTLRASMPVYAPLFLLKKLVKSSRPQLREMITKAQPSQEYSHGQQIGKSHTLLVKAGSRLQIATHGQQIVLTLPQEKTMSDPEVVRILRDASIGALRKEAKSYLPRRLAHLAEQLGFTYAKVRFSHASSRWGSCSSEGTISLNIALMKLPFEAIDYVLIHELAHTVEMNHSPRFWDLVEAGDPKYKLHRKYIKSETPSI